MSTFCRRRPRAIVALGFALALGGFGCASGPSQTEVPSTEPESSGDEPPPAASAHPTAKASPPQAPSSARPDDSREITGSECQALSDKYEELTINDQMAKEVSAKLTDAQRETARRNIGVGAKKLASNWREACVRDLTGKVASEQALRCAMASRSVAAFETCLNGGGASPSK